MNETGYFIVLEGGEGSGKSTAAAYLKEAFEARGYNVVLTREPGGVASAEHIRRTILSHDMDAWTEALLFAAGRNEHLNQKVVPALEEGKVVICDRYIHSSLAYQGHAGGVGMERVYSLNAPFLERHKPDLVLFLDIAPEAGLKRIADNNRETNRMDEKSLAYHRAVYEGYQKAKADYLDMMPVAADISLEQLKETMTGIVEERFPARQGAEAIY